MVAWEIRNGIAVPARVLQPIAIFVDETFFQDRSGFLQAAFVAPQDIYDQVIVPRSRALLRELGPDAKEFKGSAIKRGNVRPYREFLRLFINISAAIADQAPSIRWCRSMRWTRTPASSLSACGSTLSAHCKT